MDLFDKRWDLFEKAERAVADVLRDADVRSNQSIGRIALMRNRAKFLFGPEVEKYLGELQRDLSRLGLASDMLGKDTSKDWPTVKEDIITRVGTFDDDFMKLLGPYMKQTARL